MSLAVSGYSAAANGPVRVTRMSALLTPKTVDSGWLLRWCKQGVALWLRSPLWLLGNVILAPMVMAFLPRLDAVKILLIVPLSAGVFVELRLLDHYSAIDFSQLWQVLQGNLKDIALLTRDLFLLIFAVGLIIAMVQWPVTDKAHSTIQAITARALAHGGLLEIHAFSGINTWLSLICEPMAAPILFLTLLVGHQLTMHAHVSYIGMIKNLRIALLFLVICFWGELAFSAITVFLKPTMGSDGALVLSTLFASLVLMMFSTFGYLWCREMFEGQKENVAAFCLQAPKEQRA